MILKKTIPKDFYKLFRTRNMDAYMMFLVSIYDENNEVYTALGLTIEDGQAIIGEVCSKMQIEWMEDSEEAPDSAPGTPSAILNTLIRWGWIKSDYDEQLNTYILSFPEYSQLYVELFKKLQSEDDSRERESILSIYSALFTYQAEPEKNNGILRSALATSKNLETLLSNMQNGMRTYFDVLSASRNFIQIQQVLVEEINNSDSQRYAILTTTDSFYRYKESVKELISQILSQHDLMKTELSRTLRQSTANTPEYTRAETALRYSDEAVGLIYKIERQFDLIERKYNKLVEQKAVFAKRALARIHYIFQEGAAEEDSVIRLLHLIEKSPEPERILGALGTKICLTAPFKRFDDNSIYKRHDSSETPFQPLAVERAQEKAAQITDFVPKPRYTRKELKAFCDRNIKDGVFRATAETVQSVEDLEKLLFLWQEVTGKQTKQDLVQLGGEIQNEEGFTFSALCMTMEEEFSDEVHRGVVAE